jgi:putative spermidine/putrescine transport system substrate-binding protein
MILPLLVSRSPHRRRFALLAAAAVLLATVAPLAAADDAWDQILRRARGQTVDWFMWGGFPSTNAYVNDYLVPELQRRFGITLRQVPVKDIAEVVGKLLVEKQVGKAQGGAVDLMWINGENFRTAKRNGLLFGPFAERLPSGRYVDWQRPALRKDFGEPVDGLESPWGSAQVVMIYDSHRVAQPPRSMAALIDWIRSHPGRFTYPAPPDFTGSVFVRHVFYHVAGQIEAWQGPFDEGRFERAAGATYDLLRGLAPHLWRQGQTYPESPMRLNTLFADGEIDFSFSYHPAEASKLIHDGLFPATVRTFVFDEGTIANTHFVAIPFNASDTEGAMVVADFLLSPEAQLVKADPSVWGDLPALDPVRLPEPWRARFAALPRGAATLSAEELARHQLPEPPSELLMRLEKGWENRVLKGR